jgi:exodeoxyribonuclease V gamma subunit
MLYLVTSNRFEALADALLERIDAQGDRSPLEPHTLAVASLAQRRALTMALAQRHGVAMNLRFVYLAQWLWRAMAARVPGIAPDTPFDAPTLAWRVDRAFADPAFVQRRPRLAPYLGACDPAMRFAFARRTAQIVEHLTTYRRDWLERWSRGDAVPPPASIEPGSPAHRDWVDDEAWQRALWQRLERELGLPGEHPARRFERALKDDAAAGAGAADGTLPRAIHVVALPSVAPLHLELLAALARVIDVRVYALNPSRAYWVDVVSKRRLAQLRTRAPVHALHAEVGHPLLAAWGAQMQAQHALLLHHVDGEIVEDDAFVEPHGSSRLARMQRAILELDGGVTADADHDAEHGRTPIDASRIPIDDSVEIHVAHSLRRELEALQQRLLALFAQPDAPPPHEVLLATPDLDAAAPMIDAVFGAATADARIAYTITGRSTGDDGGSAAALLGLIDLGCGRWSAEDVDAVIHLPLVAQRFGWTDDDLATLHDWIGTAGMRFALDADHRRALGLAADDAWTFDDAIERLLLGHALARGDGASTAPATDPDARPLRAPLAGKLPALEVGGAQAALLGSLASLHHALRQWRACLEAEHDPAAWQRHLLWAVDTFLAPAQPAEYEGLRALRLALSQWLVRLRAADEARALPAALMRLSLEDELRERAAGAVPTGCITFASMTGLRRLPYRVIVVFGLNDGAWGASAAPAEWDLMARAPRLGDRQRRADERDVLLDLMLAARERFWIAYTGRDQRANHVLPPAAVVDEWLEALAAADGVGVDALRRRIVVEHPLQPFSSELFDPDAPPTRRSHHHGYARALDARLDAAVRHGGAVDSHTPRPRDDAALDVDLFDMPGIDDDAASADPTDIDPTDIDPTAARDKARDGSRRRLAAAPAADRIGAAHTVASGAAPPAAAAALVPPVAAEAGDASEPVDDEEDDADDPGLSGNDEAVMLFTRPLSAVPARERRIDVRELQAFFANPAKALLERRLGITLPRTAEPLRGDEPFVVEPLDRAGLARCLMPALLADADDETLAAYARASGLLPSAALGDATIGRELDALRQQAAWLPGGTPRRPAPREIVVPTPDGPWQLVVDTTYHPHDGLAIWRTSKMDAKPRLEAWIEHLALHAVVDDAGDARTRLVTRDKVLPLEALRGDEPGALDPLGELRDLVRLMDEGLRAPLPFMPELSWRALGPLKPSRGARRDARPTPQGERELADPWLLLAWRGRSLVDDPRFLDVAQRVYGALRTLPLDEVDL